MSKPKITVCNACLRAICWQGIMMCEDTREELVALDREHSDWWDPKKIESFGKAQAGK